MQNEYGHKETTPSRAVGTFQPLKHFEIIPAISIRRSRIVEVKGEKYIPLRFRGTEPNALDLMDILFETFETLLLLDLEGIYKNRPAIDFYRKVSQLGDIWVDGGVRYSEGVIDILIGGAQSAVLGTKTLDDLSELRDSYELTENIIFGLDYNNGILSPNDKLCQEASIDVVKEVKSMGITTCLFADLGRVDSEKALELSLIRALMTTGMKIYVGGGIKRPDLKILTDMKVSGAVVELRDVLNNPSLFALDPSLLNEIAPE